MLSQRAPVVVGLLLVALGAATPAHGSARRAADYPTIDVVFNSNDTLTVTFNGTPLGTSSGAPTTITPGSYNMSLTDPTYVSNMQFHLEGPGVKLVSIMSYGEEPPEVGLENFAPGSARPTASTPGRSTPSPRAASPPSRCRSGTPSSRPRRCAPRTVRRLQNIQTAQVNGGFGQWRDVLVAVAGLADWEPRPAAPRFHVERSAAAAGSRSAASRARRPAWSRKSR